MPETTTDLIRQIGNTLTDLDMLAASPSLSEAEFKEVRRKRRALDRKQLELVQASFRDSTQKFQKAAAGVKEANDGVKKTIADVDKVAETLAAVSVLITAAEKLLSIAIP